MQYPVVSYDWTKKDVKREEDNLAALFIREMRKKPMGSVNIGGAQVEDDDEDDE